MNSAIVILAAGASTRLGEPKQELSYQGVTLLEHACQVALDASPSVVLVVLGSHEHKLRPRVPSGVAIVSSPDWSDGLASSIRAGIMALPAETEVVLLTLVDQPLILSDHLRALLDAVSQHPPLAASRYPDGSPGVPAAFHRSIFPELMDLRGDVGAKAVLTAHPDLATVDLTTPLDIDRAADYEKLQQMEKG